MLGSTHLQFSIDFWLNLHCFSSSLSLKSPLFQHPLSTVPLYLAGLQLSLGNPAAIAFLAPVPTASGQAGFHTLSCLHRHPSSALVSPSYPPPYLGSLCLIKTFLPFPIPKQASQVNLPHSASLSPQLSFFEPLACVRALHFNKPQTDRLLHQSPIPQRRGNPAFPPASGGGLH